MQKQLHVATVSFNTQLFCVILDGGLEPLIGFKGNKLFDSPPGIFNIIVVC